MEHIRIGQKLMYSTKLLTWITILIISACASEEKTSNTSPEKSILERIPIVYRQDIQQGNVITQEIVNQLRLGLSKRQVRFIMGTPMLIDVFHQSRWDYVYTMTYGWGEMESKKLQLYFDENEQLVRIEGDLKPLPNKYSQPIKQEVLVSVPDYKDPHRGIIKKAAEQISSILDNSTEDTQ